MYAFAFFPRSVPCATLCRKMLPVEMCGTPRYAASLAAWVPCPRPAGPSRPSPMSRRERGRRPILEELVRRGGRSDGRVVDGPPVREWIAIRVRRDDYERLSHRRIQDHRRPWARGDDCGPSVPDSDCLHHLARPTEIVHDD